MTAPSPPRAATRLGRRSTSETATVAAFMPASPAGPQVIVAKMSLGLRFLRSAAAVA